MVISVTRPSEEHVMDVQVHGFGSRRFQLEKGGGGGGDAEFSAFALFCLAMIACAV